MSIYENAILIFSAECIIIRVILICERYRAMFSFSVVHMVSMKNMGYFYACLQYSVII